MLAVQEIMASMIVSRRAKLAYMPIQKSGCSSLKAYIRRLEGMTDDLPLEKIHSKRESGVIDIDKLSADQVFELFAPRRAADAAGLGRLGRAAL